MTTRAKWVNVALRELAWLAAFLFWAYYRKPADSSLLRIDSRGIVGLALVAAGIVLQFWSAIILAEAIVNPPGFNGVAEAGPYRYVRNPIYE